MDTYTALTSRCSIRKFNGSPVSDEVVIRCLEAARWAPSGGNTQPWRFIVVRDGKTISQFDPYHHQPWVNMAPVVIVCCSDITAKSKKYDESMDNYFVSFLDMGASIQNILLAAHDSGLGAVWIAAFSPRKVRELCHIPETLQIVSLVCLGHFDDDDAVSFRETTLRNRDRRGRKPLQSFCFGELYGAPLQGVLISDDTGVEEPSSQPQRTP